MSLPPELNLNQRKKSDKTEVPELIETNLTMSLLPELNLNQRKKSDKTEVPELIETNLTMSLPPELNLNQRKKSDKTEVPELIEANLTMSLLPELNLNQRKKSDKTEVLELIETNLTMSLPPELNLNQRKKSDKTEVDGDEARRRREDIMSQQLPLDDASHQPFLNREKWFENIQGVWSEDPALQMEATTQFRKLLSVVPPLRDEVIKAGVIPRLVEFLGRNDLPQLQFESGLALTNVAAGSSERTRVVIEQGAVPRFVRLLSSANDDVREQAVWALGNVARDSTIGRNLSLGYGALTPLLDQLKDQNSRMSMLIHATWTLANFCKGKPPIELVKLALPVLRQLIRSNDEQVLTYACWSLSYLSNSDSNDKIQAVIEAGVCPRLVELMLHSSPEVILPATRTVGNILTGNDAQTQFMIDNHVLHSLYQLLTRNHDKNIKTAACWVTSNITAGNRNQIEAVIAANIIPHLIRILEHASEFDIKKEAAWAISNAIAVASQDQIRYLVRQGCIKSLCDLLICPDLIIVYRCLQGLENILKMGEAEKEMGMSGGLAANVYAEMVVNWGGLFKIKNLQTHENKRIYEKAVKLLENYWGKKSLSQELMDLHSMVYGNSQLD